MAKKVPPPFHVKKDSLHQPIRVLETLPGLILKATFYNGVVKTYDMRKVQGYEPDFFTNMTEEEFAKTTKLCPGGQEIVWTEREDMCCSEIWVNGETIEEGWE